MIASLPLVEMVILGILKEEQKNVMMETLAIQMHALIPVKLLNVEISLSGLA